VPREKKHRLTVQMFPGVWNGLYFSLGRAISQNITAKTIGGDPGGMKRRAELIRYASQLLVALARVDDLCSTLEDIKERPQELL